MQLVDLLQIKDKYHYVLNNVFYACCCDVLFLHVFHCLYELLLILFNYV
jgi:hypothetical protein